MIYTPSEKRRFKDTIARATHMYKVLLDTMREISEEKAKVRDVATPIHHRMSPLTMLSLAQAKTRRLESMLSSKDWEANPETRDRVVEECVDVANYALYIGSVCLLIDDEEGIKAITHPPEPPMEPAVEAEALLAAQKELNETLEDRFKYPLLGLRTSDEGVALILRYPDHDVQVGVIDAERKMDIEDVKEFIKQYSRR